MFADCGQYVSYDGDAADGKVLKASDEARYYKIFKEGDHGSSKYR